MREARIHDGGPPSRWLSLGVIGAGIGGSLNALLLGPDVRS